MAEHLTLTVLSPNRTLISSLDVSEVIIPGAGGELQVLPGHANMVGSIETGRFSFRNEATGEETAAAVSSGFFHIREGKIRVLAETLELPTEIDVARAERAKEQAEALLTEGAPTEENFRKHELKLQRALIRQKLAGK